MRHRVLRLNILMSVALGLAGLATPVRAASLVFSLADDAANSNYSIGKFAYLVTLTPDASPPNVRQGDGIVIYDFAGFTGSWSFTGLTNSLASLTTTSFTQSSSNSSNNLNSYALLDPTAKAAVDAAAAGTAPGFPDNPLIPNLTFEYNVATVISHPSTIGTGRLIVFSSLTTPKTGVYGSLTDAGDPGSDFSADIGHGTLKVAAVPLPPAGILGAALLVVLGWVQFRKSHRAIA